MSEIRRLSYDPPPVHSGALPAECQDLTDLRLDFSQATNHYDDENLLWLEHGIPLEIIAKHLWHPTLRRLQAEKVFFTDLFNHEHWLLERRIKHGRSPVEDLRFLNCSSPIDYHALTAFIDSIRHLKRFVIEVKCEKGSLPPPNGPPSAVDVRPALQLHQATIEDLAIATSDHALNLVQFSSSFVPWTALQRLAVPLSTLFGGPGHHTMLHEILPPQLEELQLEKRLWTLSTLEVVKENEAIPDKDLSLLFEFAKRKKWCVPKLKRLIWWLQYPAGYDVQNRSHKLHVSAIEMMAPPTFGNVGVNFELVSTPYFKETPFGERLYDW